MMIYSPLSRARQPIFNESSGLRSTRDGDATSRQWLRMRTIGRVQGGNDHQMFFLRQQLARLRRRIVGGGATASSGMIFKGEWNGGSYSSQNVVAYTPAGKSAGMYVALRNVAAGVPPDTGGDDWFAFPNSPPGMFGA